MSGDEKQALTDSVRAITKAAIRLAETWNSSESIDLNALSVLESQTGRITRKLLSVNTDTSPRKS